MMRVEYLLIEGLKYLNLYDEEDKKLFTVVQNIRGDNTVMYCYDITKQEEYSRIIQDIKIQI